MSQQCRPLIGQYNTWLLVKSTPKCIVSSFSFLSKGLCLVCLTRILLLSSLPTTNHSQHARVWSVPGAYGASHCRCRLCIHLRVCHSHCITPVQALQGEKTPCSHTHVFSSNACMLSGYLSEYICCLQGCTCYSTHT